jgi:DNA-binding LacI/PurR family transcriptional regulator
MVKKSPTLNDVAKKAGVSHQTVSRVVNGNKNVSEKTKKKVLKFLEDTGYVRNQAARSLATGKTSKIGLLGLQTRLYGPTTIFHDVQLAARKAGYGLVIELTADIDDTSVSDGIRHLLKDGVDGIVVITPQANGSTNLQQLKLKIPIVVHEGKRTDYISIVTSKQFEGALLATEHLISLGHKNIGHLGGPLTFYEATERHRGWKAALSRNGLPVARYLVGDWSAQSGYQLAFTLLEDSTMTAIFVANDAMALGAMRAISELGLKVPDDVSLVGYDNAPETPFLVPGLTTVDQRFDLLASKSVNQLIKFLDSKSPKSTITHILPELVIRGSSSAPQNNASERESNN